MEKPVSPPLLRRRVGAHLKAIRKELGLTMVDVCEKVDRSPGWLSKMERGHVSLQAASVRLLLLTYGRPTDEIEEWAAKTRESNERGWWESEGYKDVVLDDFADHLSLEAAVSRISFFEVQLVPGIAQTADYTRALLEAHLPPDRQAEIDALIGLRMARQDRLFALEDGPQVRFVLDEPVIRRRVGGPKVLRDQLVKLLEVSQRDNVEIQILPFSAGAEAAVGHPFEYLEFRGDPDFAYHENITSSYYVRDAEDVQRHRITFERLQRAALSQIASARLIKKAMENLQ